jgi:hypothetical protein
MPALVLDYTDVREYVQATRSSCARSRLSGSAPLFDVVVRVRAGDGGGDYASSRRGVDAADVLDGWVLLYGYEPACKYPR